MGKRLTDKNKFLYGVVRHRFALLMLAPFMLAFLAFVVLPVFVSIAFSFTVYNIFETPSFNGFHNYIRLFLDDDIFNLSIRNTLLLALITGPLGYLFSLLFAWFINDLRPAVRALLVVLLTAPAMTGNAYLVWRILFSDDSYGYINSIIMRLGISREPVLWLSDVRYMMGVVITVVLWMSLGTGFLAFVAGLQNIDRSLYEAGYVDGIKNRWQELWFITLPSMKPQLLFGAVMAVTGSFAINDVTIMLCGLPSADYAAHTMVNHLIDYGFIRFEMGYACAIAVVLFALMIGINQLVQKMLAKVGT